MRRGQRSPILPPPSQEAEYDDSRFSMEERNDRFSDALPFLPPLPPLPPIRFVIHFLPFFDWNETLMRNETGQSHLIMDRFRYIRTLNPHLQLRPTHPRHETQAQLTRLDTLRVVLEERGPIQVRGLKRREWRRRQRQRRGNGISSSLVACRR